MKKAILSSLFMWVLFANAQTITGKTISDVTVTSKRDLQQYFDYNSNDSVITYSYNGNRWNEIFGAAATTDSLFLSTDKPTTNWEDNPGTTLGMEFQVSTRGTIKALKFYKWTTSTKPFIITVWDDTGGMWFTTSISTSKTGWQRIPCSLLATPGTKLLLTVYNPDSRYGFSKNVFPRTKGNLFTTGGRFGYQNAYPSNPGDWYGLDVVFTADAIPPVTTSVTPDSAVYEYRTDSIKIKGTVQNSISYRWEVVDSVGASTITGLTTLSPVFIPKDEDGCSITLMLTAIGVDSIESSSICDITVKPNPNQQIGIITRSGKILWIKQVIVTRPFKIVE